ncbi:hypothetical protein B5F37_11665 [Drancourtella sp. An210]|nr:hypothetical protein B5F37_11665 [Drancourtella sp. An210]
MTLNEAISMMRYRIDTASQILGKGTNGKAYEDMEMAISALEEIQQYRGIGTVEECREAMSRYREREKQAKCKECLFPGDRKSGRNGAIRGICRIKPQNGRRYGASSACRFFEKDYEQSEEE